MAPPPRKFESCFVRLSAGIGEKHTPIAIRIGDTRCQTRHRLRMEDVRSVRQLLRLLLDCPNNSWIAMAETGDRQAAEEIQVAIAITVVKIGAMAAHKGQWHAPVIVEQIGVREFD